MKVRELVEMAASLYDELQKRIWGADKLSYDELCELCHEVESFEENFHSRFSTISLVERLEKVTEQEMEIHPEDPYRDMIWALNMAYIDKWIERWSWKGEKCK